MNGKSFPRVSHVLEQHVTQLMIGGIIISIRTIKKNKQACNDENNEIITYLSIC